MDHNRMQKIRELAKKVKESHKNENIDYSFQEVGDTIGI